MISSTLPTISFTGSCVTLKPINSPKALTSKKSRLVSVGSNHVSVRVEHIDWYDD